MYCNVMLFHSNFRVDTIASEFFSAGNNRKSVITCFQLSAYLVLCDLKTSFYALCFQVFVLVSESQVLVLVLDTQSLSLPGACDLGP